MAKPYSPNEDSEVLIETMKQASRIFKESALDLIDSMAVSEEDKKHFKDKVNSEVNHLIEYIGHGARHGKRMRNF